MRKKKEDKSCEFYAFAIVGGNFDRCHIFRVGTDSLDCLVGIVEDQWPNIKLTKTDKVNLENAPNSKDQQIYLQSADAVLEWISITMGPTDTLHFISCEDQTGWGDSECNYILNMDLKKYKEFLLTTNPQIEESKTDRGVKFEDLEKVDRLTDFCSEDGNSWCVEVQEIEFVYIKDDEYCLS